MMTSDSTINFDEPIPEMIKRLESEHKKFELKLAEVKISVENNNIDRSAEIIRSISDKIIHHAVEEEARLMRVIMHKAKEESAESICTKSCSRLARIIHYLKIIAYDSVRNSR